MRQWPRSVLLGSAVAVAAAVAAPVAAELPAATADNREGQASASPTGGVKPARAPAGGEPARAPAGAEPASAPPKSQFAIRYMMRDMETIASVLELDSVQVSIVETMLSDYLAASTISRPAHEYATLADEFRANVLAVLSEEQGARWTDVDAAVRRSRLSVGATLPGEGIDAVGLAQGMLEPHERGSREMIAASQEYSAALDPLLARRTELMDAIRAEAVRGKADSSLRSRMDEVGPLRVAIRDLNQRTLERIASLLSEERGAMLRDRMARTAYPTVFGVGEAEALVRRAREESRSDPELGGRIDLIAGALESRLADARARALDAVRGRAEFSAGVRGSLTADQVDEGIKASEEELMKVDDWVIDTLLVEMPESSALGNHLREIVDGRDRFLRLKESGAWGNQEATVREFDADGDGTLSSAEAELAFRTYTRNVSRFAKYRL